MALSGFKYFLAGFFMFAGIQTMFLPLEPDTRLGIIYETRPTLVGFVLLFFFSGLSLMVGKLAHLRKLQGWGLFAMYNCYLFAFFLNWYAIDFHAAYRNLIGAIVVGGLYLRWKYHIYYYDPPLDMVRKKMLE